MRSIHQIPELHERFRANRFTDHDVRELELVVLHSGRIKAYVRAADEARKAAGRPVRTRPLSDSGEWPAVAEHGLAVLPRDRLAELATDPVALIDLRERLFAAVPPGERGKPGAGLCRRLPAHWGDRNREHEAASLARGPDAVARILARLEQVTPERIDPAPAAPVAEQIWDRGARLTFGHLLAIHHPDALALATDQPVALRCHWFPASRRLEVEFVAGPFSTSAPEWGVEARLIVPFADVPPVDGVVTTANRLAFDLPAGSEWDVTDAILAVIYHRAEFDAELAVPLSA